MAVFAALSWCLGGCTNGTDEPSSGADASVGERGGNNDNAGGTVALGAGGGSLGGAQPNAGGGVANPGNAGASVGVNAGGSADRQAPAASTGGRSANSAGGSLASNGGSKDAGAGPTNVVDAALAGVCATYSKNPTVTGNLFAGATGISGIVASRKQPGVLWIHGDHEKLLYAVDRSGKLLGKWEITSTSRFFFLYNWEDIDIQPMADGPDRIWIGDIGNNFAREGGAGPSGLEGDPRTAVRLLSVDEPTVDPAQVLSGTAPIIGSFDVTYPDGLHDAEAMALDPRTSDVYIFSKENAAPSKIYRAAAPVASGPLEYVGEFAADSLNGADFSPSGRELVVRNYTQAYYWTLAEGKAWRDTLAADPYNKMFRLKWTEGYFAEAIAFAVDESGLYVVSEEQEGGAPSPVEFYSKTCP